MANKRVSRSAEISEAEISRDLRLEAVSRGLRLPESAEEVEEFEAAFAQELLDAARDLPSLEFANKRGKELQSQGVKLTPDLQSQSVDSDLAIAARRGGAISVEVKVRMQQAMEQAKRQKKPDER